MVTHEQPLVNTSHEQDALEGIDANMSVCLKMRDSVHTLKHWGKANYKSM